jgi:DNA-3-methyladenine glycosylase II
MTELSSIRHRTMLSATSPFDLACSLRAMSGFAPCHGDQQFSEGRVRKAFVHPTDPGRAVVAEVGPRSDGVAGVTLLVHADVPLDPFECGQVELAVDRWLGLRDDRTQFLEVARGDPAMYEILGVAEGLHQVRFPSLAEGVVYFTLTQRSTQWFAAGRKRRIAAEHGSRLFVDGLGYVAFPTMPVLLELGPAGLTRFAGSLARAERLCEVIAGVAALDEEWLRTADYAEARAALLAIRGVGTFTAHAILLRVLGRPDDTPLEMVQFTRVAGLVYGEPAPSPAEIRARYAPWVGWWAYLVRSALPWTPSHVAATAARRSKRPAEQSSAPPASARATLPAEQEPNRVDTAKQQPSPAGAGQAMESSSQRMSVRTPQPVAPLASSPSAESDQADDDMSMCAQRSRSEPVNSRRYSAAMTAPAPTSVELTVSATSLPSAST